MNLHQKIANDTIAALKSGQKERAGVLRFLISAIKNYQIEIKAKDKEFLEDEQAIQIIRRQIKQRRDSIEQYQQGGRLELAEKEMGELAILETYLPKQIGEEEIRIAVTKALADLGGPAGANFGGVMGRVMKELKGQADGDAVRKIVEQELGNKSEA